ncbi:MbcA/ParS/Xre antitoxin family protein [Alcanivorax sp. 1008]|uniref:MbcA/ParS/Xre antitoxin family protein n=1 Tax=Alcanivorax sp. 1008 TaxID=2816853 RepID=UPI001D54D9EB|nr:MbcA/ParS/Xre antitoxin family protein [Alcanivorax sp. 1008]MCC1498082.1 DUF2384 domain-containing protein [Alcanivorax sp. 1008]
MNDRTRQAAPDQPEPTPSMVMALAADVLGSRKNAKVWLATPNAALGNQKPADLLDTMSGARQVCGVLCAIEYGGAV